MTFFYGQLLLAGEKCSPFDKTLKCVRAIRYIRKVLSKDIFDPKHLEYRTIEGIYVEAERDKLLRLWTPFGGMSLNSTVSLDVFKNIGIIKEQKKDRIDICAYYQEYNRCYTIPSWLKINIEKIYRIEKVGNEHLSYTKNKKVKLIARVY